MSDCHIPPEIHPTGQELDTPVPPVAAIKTLRSKCCSGRLSHRSAAYLCSKQWFQTVQEIRSPMAWQHLFLRFTFQGAGFTQEIEACWVDGVQLRKLPFSAELGKKPTLTALLDHFGKDGWQVVSQSVTLEKSQNAYGK